LEEKGAPAKEKNGLGGIGFLIGKGETTHRGELFSGTLLLMDKLWYTAYYQIPRDPLSTQKS